jgi:serine protease AprX
MWPNFEVHALIHRSIVTTKCDAAQRSLDALGANLVWVVLDSGIDSKHSHFERHDNLGSRGGALPHRSFVPGTQNADALRDLAGHGTHVGGILVGEQVADGKSEIVAATWYHNDRGDTAARPISLARISGLARRCRLLSCQGIRDGSGYLAALLEALEYIQDLNHGG